MRMRRAERCPAPAIASRATMTLTVLFVILLAAEGAALPHRISIGLHGGPSVPSLQGGTNEVSEGYSSRLGPFFGVSADYLLRPGLSLCVEINYSSQGGKRNGMQPIPPDPSLPLPPGTKVYASFDNEAILDYLEIPLMARLRWRNTMRLFADAGPYVGFLIRAKTVTKGSSLMYDASGAAFPYPAQDFGADTDIRQDIHSMDAGIAGGLGLDIPYGPGDIVFEAHFSYGVTNIQRDTAANGENNTGSLAFTIGYSYSIGGRP